MGGQQQQHTVWSGGEPGIRGSDDSGARVQAPVPGPQVHVKVRQQVPGADGAPPAPSASRRVPYTLAWLHLPKEARYP